VRTSFAPAKVLDLPVGEWAGHRVAGYRIQHGRIVVTGGEPFLDGCRVGSVWGTSWHGVFENDGFRRGFLTEVATAAGRVWQPGDTPFADVREARLDALGDLVAEHADTDALWRLIRDGAPSGLPTVALSTSEVVLS
jgi:adenosylcobyric acid synthase